MNHVEHRRQNCEELLPEVLALIVSCGGPIRKGDLRAIEIAQLQQETHLRWPGAKASHHVEHQIPDPRPETSDHRNEQGPHQPVPQRATASFFHAVTFINTRPSLRRLFRGSASPSGASHG
jgi:hypothetical protein